MRLGPVHHLPGWPMCGSREYNRQKKLTHELLFKALGNRKFSTKIYSHF